MTTTIPEDHVVGFGIEYDDGKRALCLQTRRADNTAIDQLLIAIDDLDKPDAVEFAIPQPSLDQIHTIERMAKLAYPLDVDRQSRYFMKQMLDFQGGLVYRNKELSLTWAHMYQAETIFNLYRHGTLTDARPLGDMPSTGEKPKQLYIGGDE